MNSEFETEQRGPRQRIEELVAAAKLRLRSGTLGRTSHIGRESIDSSDIAKDQRRFERQQARLGDRALAVKLADEAGLSGDPTVLVPVDLELGGGDAVPNLRRIADRLSRAGLEPTLVDAGEARDAFLDRAAETLGLRAHLHAAQSWSSGSDTVTSRYVGDDILCAKGWFLSTGHIVGQSTCTITVKPGRYSLGVVHGGQTRYHPQLFNLPIGSVHLNLP